jgi:glycosyltransferase involved in cell wall biosynthesis
MPPIEIDLSPLLINRTAVYNIGRDVAEILAASGEFEVRHRFFGETFDGWPDQQAAQRLLDHLEQARAAAAAGRLRGWLPPGRPRNPGGANGVVRTFVLDPLYVLFAPLTPDDIVVCYDLSTLTNPEWHDPTVAGLYAEAFDRILEAGPQLIMVSRNTADTFRANFGAYRNPLTVVPIYAPRPIEAAARGSGFPALRAASPYFLFVGSLERRKNVVGAIDAFAASGLAEEDYRLHIVGGGGQGAAEIEQRAGEVAGIVLMGFLSSEALCSVYAAATGFLYPSYLEGFGVPLLEAMVFGLPCIATNSGASPEVGGPLVLYRDPDDIAGLAHDLRAVSRLIPAERKRLANGLRRRVRSEFSFEQFSHRLLQAVRGEAAAG